MFYVSGDEKVKEVKVRARGGEGSTTFENFFPEGKMPKSYKVFAEMVLEPGCSVGQHEHHGESETYYVLSGTGEINVNGETLQAKPGDVAVCHSGSFHSAKNTSDKELRILAMIVLEPAG
ncbi:MAG: cupin domain-containing protein [Gracilibacteraceae bacterium]|jgi:quercetin dioxygenase-like cupin family protein|nr:cupin domain-containing protein [Gracilibacteraceae bacterium]